MSRKGLEKGSAGTVVLVIVVILIVILGIWYWTKGPSQPQNNSAAANQAETSSIEASLNSVDTSVQADVKGMTEAAKGQ